jgi:hypothetical protein
MITGWIERNSGDNFYGWLSVPDPLVSATKELVVYALNERRWTIPVKLSVNTRPDLALLNNAFIFEFDLEEAAFKKGVSTCTMNFAILCHDLEFTIGVTPQLVLQSTRIHGDANIGLSFGRISSDGVAVVGAGGNVFLKTGTNDVEGMYSNDNVVRISDWLALFHRRNSRSLEKNYRYIQLLIPEKSSVIHWSAPFIASKGSPGLNELVKAVGENFALRRTLVSAADFIPDEVHSEGIFRAFDTHMSTLGAKKLVDVILQRFFPDRNDYYNVGRIVFGHASGDIGGRFVEDGNVVEKPPLYCELFDKAGRPLNPILIDMYDPPTGNIGIRRSWICEDAPIRQKIVCFGGSSVERGQVSSTLAWWFSRLFSEFHFIWSPESILTIIDELNPDVVVFQTIERFLSVVPKD